jgi:hypothetical protein
LRLRLGVRVGDASRLWGRMGMRPGDGRYLARTGDLHVVSGGQRVAADSRVAVMRST